MKPELNFTIVGKTLTIREGKALELKEPVKVSVTGIMGTVSEYLTKRHETFDKDKAHVIVNRDDMFVKLVVNETDHYQHTIKGSIQQSPEFTKWGINNEDKRYHSHELALKIKMSRYQFVSLEKAAELVNVFQNLKAKVQREIEHADNNRGNLKKNFSQVVTEMTIPEKFEIITPIFKGDEKRTIPVEIVIEPESLTCSLISPDAVDIVARERDNMINAEIAKIVAIAPELAIFEI
jgi:exonuclease VII large subunit